MESITPNRFTKFLADNNFVPHLKIPTEFLRKHISSLPTANVFLVVDGDEVETRVVKIEKIGNEHFFTTGWKTTARDLELKKGMLLLFKLVEESTFHLSVYGTNGCDKMLCSSDDDDDDDDDDDEQDCEKEDDEIGGSGKDKRLTVRLTKDHESGNGKKWTLRLTKEHGAELELPKHLANAKGIWAFKKLDLVEGTGRKLGRINISKRHGKCYLADGWNEFLVRQKIVVGSTVSLNFAQCSSDIIKFEIIKSKYDGEVFCVAERRRGRPAILDRP